MKTQSFKNVAILVLVTLILVACNTADPTPTATEEPAAIPEQNGFLDKPAIPNDSDIGGVQTFPD